LEDVDLDGKIILKRMFKKWNGSVDLIDLVQDSDRWQAVVNAVMDTIVRIKQIGAYKDM